MAQTEVAVKTFASFDFIDRPGSTHMTGILEDGTVVDYTSMITTIKTKSGSLYDGTPILRWAKDGTLRALVSLDGGKSLSQTSPIVMVLTVSGSYYALPQ